MLTMIVRIVVASNTDVPPAIDYYLQLLNREIALHMQTPFDINLQKIIKNDPIK